MKKKIIFTLLTIAVLAGVGFYIKNNLFKTNQARPAIQELSLDKNKTVNIGGVTIQGDGGMKGVKIEQVEIPKNKITVNAPIPNLNREIKITTDMSDDVKKIVTAKIQDLSSQLKKSSNYLENWLILGTYYKMIGDYEGAKLAWEYITVIAPKNGLAFRNLGDLYGYYLGNPQKAEENFLKAIQNDPNQIEYYFKIVDFYREITKDLAKARAILEKGIAANPSSADLKNLLETIKDSP